MKWIVFLFFVLPLHAMNFTVLGEDSEVLFDEAVYLNSPMSLGAVSLEVFKQAGISYEGGEYGFRKIFQLENKLEILSDYEMKAYGWCYSVDGEVPEKMSDELILDGTENSIQWFYAYAHYYKGEWIAQCKKGS